MSILIYFLQFFQIISIIKSQSSFNFYDYDHDNNRIDIDRSKNEGMIRLIGGRTMFEGNVEINHFNRWGSICDDEWDQMDADVVCRQLGFVLGAIMATNNSRYGQANKLIWMDNVMCFGQESNLSSCRFDGWNIHDCDANEAAGVICRTRLEQKPIFDIRSSMLNVKKKFNFKKLPDLMPDPKEVERSAFIEHRSIMFLQCALEENCLSKSAYEIDRNKPTWIFNKRILLRFTANIRNIGEIDFRPFRHKQQWIWHSCHQHYHSMEIFATFDIIDSYGHKVAQGHKASFCLEDNQCLNDHEGKYACANYGDQGISVNCVDIYKSDLDCQWIDITDVKYGTYRLKIAINPEMKVPEMTFDNNAILCLFQYGNNSNQTVSNCRLTSL